MTEKYISIEAAIVEIKADAGCANCHVKMPGRCLTCDAGRKIRRIEKIRPADVRPVVRGKWIPYKLGDMKCSNCGGVYGVCAGLLGDYNYCPRCGADMRGVDNG